MPDTTIVVGAGPAGLSAAFTLTKEGRDVTVLESDPVYVGGISRTQRYKSYLFDIGGHRFFTKNREVEILWKRLLGPDLLERPRSSRIYYRRKFFSYPLRPFEALSKLGLFEAAHCMLSYVAARLKKVPTPRSFEDWVVQRFGRRLFQIFFETYTEKVWGMKCNTISADWASQRIQGLSLLKAITDPLIPSFLKRSKGAAVKSLTGKFLYPRLGPGMLWQRCAEAVREKGGRIEMGRKVVKYRYDAADRSWEVLHQGAGGEAASLRCQNLVTSAPLRELALHMDPPAPQAVQEAARALRYRDFLTVVLMCRGKNAFTDQWIYVHDPDVKVGRIQNFRSWSPEMVQEPGVWTYGMEYFCFDGDDLWSASDEALIALAKKEISQIGIVAEADIFDGCVVRQPKAYPVYDEGYVERVELIRRWMAEERPTLHPVGRNGMHRYNNQDHAMMTGILAARNILAGRPLYDPWLVNQDAEYHEAGESTTTEGSALRLVPSRLSPVSEN
jgi:protoporphyrinogen oxidase